MRAVPRHSANALQREALQREAAPPLSPCAARASLAQEKRDQKDWERVEVTVESVFPTSENISSVCALKRCIVGEVKSEEDTFWLKRSSAWGGSVRGSRMFCFNRVQSLHVEYAERGDEYGILFIFSLFCECGQLEYVRIHAIYRV